MKNVKHAVKLKLLKWPHKNIGRNTELLELIHTDLCEFEGKLTHGGNEYFINFVDDFLKYAYVYLLKKIKVMLLRNLKNFLEKLRTNSGEK